MAKLWGSSTCHHCSNIVLCSTKDEKQALLDELDQREGAIAELERKVAKLTTIANVKREREERVRTRCLLVKVCVLATVAAHSFSLPPAGPLRCGRLPASQVLFFKLFCACFHGSAASAILSEVPQVEPLPTGNTHYFLVRVMILQMGKCLCGRIYEKRPHLSLSLPRPLERSRRQGIIERYEYCWLLSEAVQKSCLLFVCRPPLLFKLFLPELVPTCDGASMFVEPNRLRCPHGKFLTV